MSKLKIGSIIVALLVLSSGLQYFFGPKRVEFKEKIKIVEVVNTQVRTITRNEKRPDGTVITTTTDEAIKNVVKSKEKDTEKKELKLSPEWLLSASYGLDGSIGASVQKKLIFGLYGGVSYHKDTISAVLTYSF